MLTTISVELLPTLSLSMMMMMNSSSFFLLQLSLLLLFSVAFSNSHGRGNETDRVSLLAIKDQLAQNPALTSWNSSLHFCNWEGVTCAPRHQRVMVLNLSSRGMVGSISPYVGNLSFLRILSFENNNLYGEIPHQLGRLFRLQELHLYNNSLSGGLPANLSQCLQLEFLGLYYNNLTGKIPEEIGSLRKLKEFSAYENQLSGKIPNSFRNISSLQVLYLYVNMFTGSIPDSIGQLKQLYELQLGVNMLSGMVPPSLYNISSLGILVLPFNRLQGSLPRDIGLTLPNLVYLGIGDNMLHGSIPVSLFTNASQLYFLAIANNSFTGQVPVEVGNLKRLQYLNLEVNHLGSGGEVDDLSFITSLSNCSNLSGLSIAVNDFGGMLPNSVANLSTKLTRLYLGYNQISGSIPPEIWKLSNLILLSLPVNILTGVIPPSIGMLHKLQVLYLASNRLSGTIPYSIGNMSSLYWLGLSDNMLQGNIVSSIEKCKSLELLQLSSNNFTGTIPKLLFGITYLSEISLSQNNFVGSLPSKVESLKALRILDAANNKITGEIPSTLGSCSSLETLYLQGNFFQGLLPSSFRYLKAIQLIDLLRNNISGNISQVLEELPFLQSLNLSFNNFAGEVPTKGFFQNASSFSILGNHNLCGGITSLHLPKCPSHKSIKKGMPLALKVTIAAILLLFITSSLLVVLYWRKRHGAKPASARLENSIPRVSYSELYEGTNGFSLANLIGKGSYGYVYKGVLREVEGVVAVKVLNLVESGALKGFMAECNVLRSIRHRNLLKILTVCSSVDFQGNDFKALVFELMSNGSLEKWLHQRINGSQRPSGHLNLLQRLDISIDVASALDYLHNNCERSIIHCDLKPSNVLLDDGMVGCVGDFGLAKFLSKNTSNVDRGDTDSIAIRGTIGYIPPEYGMGAEVSTQGDVYSYGIMLLEIFTGKRPTHGTFNNDQNLHDFCKRNLPGQVIDYLDMSLFVDIPNESTNGDIEEHKVVTAPVNDCLVSIISIGVACLSESIPERMNIKDVLTKLHKIRKVFVRVCNYEED